MKKRNNKLKIRYPEDRRHPLSVLIQIIIVVIFLAASLQSVISIAHNYNIAGNLDIYKQNRQYDCATISKDISEDNNTDSGNIFTTDFNNNQGLVKEFLVELNPNPNFIKYLAYDDVVTPQNYTTNTYGDLVANFEYHNQTPVNLLATISDDGKVDSGANWAMEKITNTDAASTYLYLLKYTLVGTQAVVVAEETLTDGKIKHRDIQIIKPPKQIVDTSLEVSYTPMPGTVSFRIYAQIKKKGSIKIFSESIKKLPSQTVSFDSGVVSISFDDGLAGVYKNALEVFDELDIKTTQFIIPETLREEYPAYMKVDQVREFESKGHEIGSHSLRHCSQTKLTPEDIKYDMTRSKQILENAFGKVQGYAYPYGLFSDQTQQFAEQNYDYIRTSKTGFNSRMSDISRLQSVTINNETTFEDFKSYVDFAKTNKLWLILVYHDVKSLPETAKEFAIDDTQLRKQLAYIKLSKLSIKPIGNFVKELKTIKPRK